MRKGKRTVVFVLWAALQLDAFCLVIALLAATAKAQSVWSEPALSAVGLEHREAFVCVWTALLVAGAAVASSLVSFRQRWKTSMAFGFMIGSHVITSQLGLIMAVKYGQAPAPFDATVFSATAFFGAVYFLLSLAMLALWIAWRGLLIGEHADNANLANQMGGGYQADPAAAMTEQIAVGPDSSSSNSVALPVAQPVVATAGAGAGAVGRQPEMR